jgi:predicted metal-dependent enzyme (double-stranded beta helix superfamily)
MGPLNLGVDIEVLLLWLIRLCATMDLVELEKLIQDCRQAIDKGDEVERAVREIVAAAVADPARITKALGERDDAGLKTLYRDATLTIIDFAWAPWMCFKPHTHNMWSIVGLISGREDNVFWRRTPDNKSIEAAGARSLGAGDVTTLGADIIHSVTNPIGKFTRAIHIYGGDFFAPPTTRSEWDPETLAEREWNMDHTRQLFAEAEARFRNSAAASRH